jgi:hypothetical protein
MAYMKSFYLSSHGFFGRRAASVVAALGLVGVLSACADPEGALQDFIDRKEALDSSSSSGSGGSSGAGGNATCAVPEPGTYKDEQYLFSLSVYLGPTKPVLLLASLSTPAFEGGTGIQVDLQPLAVDDMSEVGGLVRTETAKIQDDGSFTLEARDVKVPGEANPLSGLDIESDLLTILGGSICDPEFACGDVEGTLTKPFILDLSDQGGTHWTNQRLEAPGEYPTPLLNCAKDTP